jgi:methylmalonyl-CoA/ethylmalonyl-CoA epimerase
MIRRLDHIGVLVRDSETALTWFRDVLGLQVALVDIIDTPPVKLTYLDCGNSFLQLVEPLDPDGPLFALLDRDGEGFHHVCFGVDDPEKAARAMSSDGSSSVTLGSGRGRRSVFAPGPVRYGLRLECTEFDRAVDVDGSRGFLP